MIITPSLKFTLKIINITFQSVIYISKKLDASIKCCIGGLYCCYCCGNEEMIDEYYSDSFVDRL